MKIWALWTGIGLVSWGAYAAPPSREAETTLTTRADALKKIRVATLDGRPVKLDAYRAAVTVIAAWATWCKPCLEEMPYVEELYRRYRGQFDVSIIAINVERLHDDASTGLGKIRKVVREIGITLPVLADQYGDFAREMMGPDRLIPVLVFIDRDSNVLREVGRIARLEEFVARHENTIELALHGKLPKEESTINFNLLKVVRIRSSK